MAVGALESRRDAAAPGSRDEHATRETHLPAGRVQPGERSLAIAAPTQPRPKAYRKPISPAKANRINRGMPIHQTHGVPSLFLNFTTGL